MAMFVDTSAIYARIVDTDARHREALALWADLAERRETLVTSNYVVLESISLLTRRVGLAPVRAFQADMVPVLRVRWVDEALHGRAMAAFLSAGDRRLSLVDCVSFEVMRRFGLDTAFDADFTEAGFRCIP